MSDYQMREVYGKKVPTMNIPSGFKTMPPNACFRQLRKQEKLINELEAKNKRLVDSVRAYFDEPKSNRGYFVQPIFDALKENDDE